MKYLYSNMPYSDVGNYTFDTYLDFVQQGIYLWENFSIYSGISGRVFFELYTFSQGKR